MMIKRIIILVESSFNERDYKRFGIEKLRDNGFEVEVWDATPAIHPNVYKNYAPPDKFDYDRITVFHDIKELYKNLKNLRRKDFVINLISYIFEAISPYRALSRSRADYAVFVANKLPYAGELKFFAKLKDIKNLFPLTREKLLMRIFARTPSGMFGIKAARFILAGGNRSLMTRYPVNSKTEIVWAHALDYDIYLEEKNQAPAPSEPTAIFLDEYLPFHPSWKLMRYQFPMSPSKYYDILNNLFDKIEKEIGLKVKIAAHPRSDYNERDSYFKGRECKRGSTCGLIKESNLVIAHASTSVNFANLFYKPVLFATSRDLDRCWEGPIIRTMARWFGKKPVFIDDGGVSIDWKDELTVNKKCYDDYRRAYIKRDSSKDMPFWQIVADKLKCL